MSPVDAANLLIGLASPGDHTKAGQSVLEAGKLKLEAIGEARGTQGAGFFDADDDGNKFGVHAGQSLREALAAILESYSLAGPLPSAEKASKVEAEQEGSSGRASIFPAPRDTDPAPCAVSLSITTDSVDWNAEIVLRQRGGDRFTLRFSRYGDVWPPHGPKLEKPDFLEVFSITLKPATFHAAACCIRGEDAAHHPFRASR